MYNLPIITIEIENLTHTIKHAMSEHLAAMDVGLQEALEMACKNFDYRGYVLKEANRCIENALSEAIKTQFQYGGAGYQAVQIVAENLAKSALKTISERKSS